MSFHTYWISLRIKNPQLDNDNRKMTITVSSFCKELQKAYEKGWDAADLTGTQTKPGMPDFMADLFK